MTTEIEAALYDKLAVIARLDRAIQWSLTVVFNRNAAAYGIPRLRGE